jgi:hypothetical protein
MITPTAAMLGSCIPDQSLRLPAVIHGVNRCTAACKEIDPIVPTVRSSLARHLR